MKTLTPTPVSDKLKDVIETLKGSGFEREAEVVDDVRRDCMALERRAVEDGEHYTTVLRELHQEIRDLKAAARASADADSKAEDSALKVLSILRRGKDFGSLIYIDGVERFDYRQMSLSVLRPVFTILKRQKDVRVKGHTLKLAGATIYGRKA